MLRWYFAAALLIVIGVSGATWLDRGQLIAEVAPWVAICGAILWSVVAALDLRPIGLRLLLIWLPVAPPLVVLTLMSTQDNDGLAALGVFAAIGWLGLGCAVCTALTLYLSVRRVLRQQRLSRAESA